jgi:DNA processing protein
MADTQELLHTLALLQLKGVGNNILRRLTDYFGSAHDAFLASEADLVKEGLIGAKIIETWDKQQALAAALKEIELLQTHKIGALSIANADYPYKLMNCYDAPAVLYFLGNTDYKGYKFISIVGTRNASAYGLELCRNFVRDIKQLYPKVVIVSGLAAGIDACAHKAALDNELPTLAVLGHGLNTIYPAGNRELAAKIAKSGALITEYSFNSRIMPENFARRNRIVAGLSDATIVVETGTKGGSLITADLALNYNRDVYAFPGRVGDTRSAGCNLLIKKNTTALIENAADFLDSMQWMQSNTPKAVQQELFIRLTAEEEIVYQFLKDKSDVFIDMIAHGCAMSMQALSPVLLSLEFSGLIKTLPGKMYRIV